MFWRRQRELGIIISNFVRLMQHVCFSFIYFKLAEQIATLYSLINCCGSHYQAKNKWGWINEIVKEYVQTLSWWFPFFQCFSFYIVARAVLYYWTSTVKYYRPIFTTFPLLCSFTFVKWCKNLSDRDGGFLFVFVLTSYMALPSSLLSLLMDSFFSALYHDWRHLKWPLLSCLFPTLEGNLSSFLQTLSVSSQ